MKFNVCAATPKVEPLYVKPVSPLIADALVQVTIRLSAPFVIGNPPTNDDPVIVPEAFILPTTSNFSDGLDWLIPTSPFESMTNFAAPPPLLPKLIWKLVFASSSESPLPILHL